MLYLNNYNQSIAQLTSFIVIQLYWTLSLVRLTQYTSSQFISISFSYTLSIDYRVISCRENFKATLWMYFLFAPCGLHIPYK